VTPLYVPEAERRRTNGRGSYAEFRSRARAAASSTATDEYRNKVFWKWVTTSLGPFSDTELSRAEWLKAEGVEHRVLSKATGAAGGYLVPGDFEDRILTIARARGSVARLALELQTESGEELKLPATSAHGTAAWVAENAAVTATDDTFAQVSLNAFKAVTKTIVSEELAQDSEINLDTYLAEELGRRIAVLEGAAFVNGDGSGKPQGFLANVTAVTAATGSATTFSLADLVNVLHAVPVGYRDPALNPAWLMSDGALKALRNVKDSAGAPILLNASDPGNPPMLLGYPVYIDENMPAPAASAKSVAFGGWRAAYAIRRVNGVGMDRQDEIHSETGQIGFRARHRVDGRVYIADAARALAYSAS
jgi:HK97 family phage major capsid protein